jgi:TIR domain
LIKCGWDDSESETGPGTIQVQAWGNGADDLVEILLHVLQTLPVGQSPEITGTISPRVKGESFSPASTGHHLIGSTQVDKLEDLNFGETRDFFVSYTKADQPWAEWIAWKLEEAGYSTLIQAWDFRPGGNFVLEMQKAASGTENTIVVLSPAYLQSEFTQPEWAAAFAQDPQGETRKLIPVRIAKCKPTGLLKSIIYVDLVGLPEEDARTALLGAFNTRNKPTSVPAFPGPPTPQVPHVSPVHPYPGATSTSSASVAPSLLSRAESSSHAGSEAALTRRLRLQFVQRLNALPPQQFNMLVYAVNPPAGLIPPMPAPQGDRSVALLAWAEGPGGCGVSVLQDLSGTILTPPVGPSHLTITPIAAGHSLPANDASNPPSTKVTTRRTHKRPTAIQLGRGGSASHCFHN